MAVSVRKRFEVFKRDGFTCRYCGRSSPDVVLEVDHIVPVCQGGSDEAMNLATSCWECNSGKSGVPLGALMTGEDPHDKAVQLLERERQLREYNEVLRQVTERRREEAEELINYWKFLARWGGFPDNDKVWLLCELDRTPAERMKQAMRVAVSHRKTDSLKYVAGVLRNWKKDEQAE